MKAKILIIGLLAIVSLNSFKNDKTKENVKTDMATTNIVGVVMDELSGEALAGVEVFIEGTDLKAYTDFDGKFTFKKVRVGDYSIGAKLISYKEINGKKITSSFNNNNDIKLGMNLQN